MKTVALNLSLFKIGWLAVVFSAAAGMPEVGAATAALVAIVHLVRADATGSEIKLLVIAAVLGLAWETLLVQTGQLRYPSTGASELAPYWIVALWILFATTLNVGMRWLRKNLLLAVVAGAVGGPLSFLAGQQAGAVELGEMAVPVIAIGWAVLLPFVAWIAASFDGYAETLSNRTAAGEPS